ncbi:helix-turn-helix domain-containing protein [Pediococcus inopinatus]|uniref:Helix-turn-helix domain-containing protein n=1 Tax=Pediococcus inopinatus TaxID=114090 RepID=A0ABZ0Q625_9LACO|nr:helix-turn-helix domain-containing protein [Pediococcus inopinatus]WPC17408.1 helix-turn-helix domain-containing protein [Pediococcus inopinatus]WPC18776.1 helix-turn-helix domain-containing protein [Pediococcus inopinatus]WPC22396.1 helix-turn-helix domain-containing protein [Pediococcus inopinatus]WPP08675.1 helix-turn-helix domain-containing protein [Pediococcus inopinatus]
MKKLRIDLNDEDYMGSHEASVMWGKQKDYVRTIFNKYPKRFPEGTIRKFGKQLVVTREGMEAVTGIRKDQLVDKK